MSASLADLYAETITHKAVDGYEVEIGTTVMASVAPAHIVWAGEYPAECADLLIRIEHAVDADGNDISAQVAQAITDAITGDPR